MPVLWLVSLFAIETGAGRRSLGSKSSDRSISIEKDRRLPLRAPRFSGGPVRSTMMDIQLTTALIRRRSMSVHGSSEVVTWDQERPRRTTFANLGRRSAQLAHALRGLGVKGDHRVATFMWNNQEHVEAYLAVPSMGAVLHTLNPRLPPEQISWIANHAQDSIVVASANLLPALSPALRQMSTARHLIVVGGEPDVDLPTSPEIQVHQYEPLLASQSEHFPWPDEIDEQCAAAICYTSGTTGLPKGVAYSHRSTYLHMLSLIAGDAVGITGRDRILPLVPMFHVNAWGLIYAALATGASLVLPDRFTRPEHIVAILESSSPTLAAGVPTIWSDLLRSGVMRGRSLAPLRILSGGSTVPKSLIQCYLDEFDVEIIQSWGMTEMSPAGTFAVPPPWMPEKDARNHRASAGRLAINVEARVVDQAANELPNDGISIGEIEVRGPAVTGSYIGDAAPDRFHDGWLKTGDVGCIDAHGYLTITDRAKDVIKSGGEWISSVDLENALMTHSAVAEAAVIAVPDPRWQERPLAVVVLAEASTATSSDMRRYLATQFASWQIPEYWCFVEEIPKTSVGKFDKKYLRARYSDASLVVIEDRSS